MKKEVLPTFRFFAAQSASERAEYLTLTEPIVRGCVAQLEAEGIKVLDWNFGPLASVEFEGDPRKLPKEILDQFEVIGNAETPMQALGNFSPGFVESLAKPTPGYYATIRQSLPRIGMDKVWADSEWDGGSSLIFCILDTGLDDIYYVDPPYPNHPEGAWYFSGRIIEHWQAYPWGGSKHYHCRICLAVIMKARHEYEGEVWQGGMPKARAYVAQVLDSRGQGTSGTVRAGFEWGLSRDPLPMIFSVSLGGDHDPVLDACIARCWEMGIPVAVASGNNGVFPPACNGRINCPADAEENLAVGATDGGYEQPGQPEMAQTWVARNKRKDGTVQKHFLSAPGVRIQVEMGEPAATGTSLAAPHAALVLGVIFYYLMRKPLACWTFPELAARARDIIEQTCLGLGYEKDPQYINPDPNAPLWDQPHYCIQGHGRIDAEAAMKLAKEGPTEEKITLKLDGVKIHEWDYKGAGTYPYQVETSGLEAPKIYTLRVDLPNKEFAEIQVDLYKEEEQPLKPRFNKPKPEEAFKKGDPIPVEVIVE